MRRTLVGLALYQACASLCLALCDDAKFNIKKDLPDKEAYQCPEGPWPVQEMVIPSLALRYPEQEISHRCMDQQIKYNQSIPNSGAHRPKGAQYGEYEFCPPQRWLHNLEHGAVAFLYHPCVDPGLKEDLCLLARACLHKHIITPHVTLTKERPLALAAWTATLQMQQVSLTEAVAWLRQYAGRCAKNETEDTGVYGYLLTRPAVPDDGDRSVCPEAQMLSRYFNRRHSSSHTGEWKWGERSLTGNHHVVVKRKRRHPRDTTSSRTPTKMTPAQSTAELHEGRSRDASGVTVSEERQASLTPSEATFQEHQQVASGYNTTENESARRSTKGSDRPRGGWQENNIQHDGKAESIRSVPGDQDHARLEEEGNARAIPGKAENTKDTPREVEDKRSTAEEQQYADRAGSSDGIGDTKERGAAGQDHNVTRGSSRGNAPSSETVQSVNLNPATQSPRPDNVNQRNSSPEGAPNPQNPAQVGPVEANVSEALAGPKNQSQSGVSSEPLDAGDSGGIAAKDSDASLASGGARDGVSKQVFPVTGNLSTTSPGHGEKSSAGKEQCVCLGGSAQDLVSHQKHQALARVGALGKVKHAQVGPGAPRAIPEMFVRTPRTEEAAWAAAALSFLFVLLTLAVLYTRLWKKFRKSESLYWAPGSDQEGQETVSAVIKRRLAVGQSRKKRRQSYKKRPLVFYENLSDSSD